MEHYNSFLDNLIVFVGGTLLSLTHPITSTIFIFNINYLDITLFVLRAFAGGALALLGKVGIEWCIRKVKSKRKTEKQQ